MEAFFKNDHVHIEVCLFFNWWFSQKLLGISSYMCRSPRVWSFRRCCFGLIFTFLCHTWRLKSYSLLRPGCPSLQLCRARYSVPGNHSLFYIHGPLYIHHRKWLFYQQSNAYCFFFFLKPLWCTLVSFFPSTVHSTCWQGSCPQLPFWISTTSFRVFPLPPRLIFNTCSPLGWNTLAGKAVDLISVTWHTEAENGLLLQTML